MGSTWLPRSRILSGNVLLKGVHQEQMQPQELYPSERDAG